MGRGVLAAPYKNMMHEYIGFTVTIALIVAGILFNRQDFRELRKELIDVRKEIADLRTELVRDYVRKQ